MNDRIQIIDAIRGIAILLVLAWHILRPPLMKAAPWTNQLLQMTWSGVDLFFVLSGLLIGGILMRNRDAPNYFVAFYARRFLRILPLYAVAIVVFLLLAPGTEPLWTLASFTQNIYWAFEGRFGNSMIGVTWSLAVEEQFYLVLPLLIWVTPTTALPWLLGALAIVAPALRFALYLTTPGAFFPAYMLFPARMDALLIGVLIAWAMANPGARHMVLRHRLAIKIAAVILLAGIVGTSIMEIPPYDRMMFTIGYTWIAAAYGAVIILALTSKRHLPKAVMLPLSAAGIACFSLYLFHIPLSAALSRMFPWGQVSYPVLTFHLIYLLVLAAVALASWYAVERPCIRFGHRRFGYRS